MSKTFTRSQTKLCVFLEIGGGEVTLDEMIIWQREAGAAICNPQCWRTYPSGPGDIEDGML